MNVDPRVDMVLVAEAPPAIVSSRKTEGHVHSETETTTREEAWREELVLTRMEHAETSERCDRRLPYLDVL